VEALGVVRSDLKIVEFRLIVFRPFKQEILLGKISSQGPSGINGMGLAILL
jgi:DNA-directed RNA polymerase subunit E'/Rpb7